MILLYCRGNLSTMIKYINNMGYNIRWKLGSIFWIVSHIIDDYIRQLDMLVKPFLTTSQPRFLP